MQTQSDKIARRRLGLSGGGELAYVTAGDPSYPGLLLLHGYASSSATFRDVILPLSRAAHVIAPDLPGYGESDPLPAPSFAALSDAIGELLRHLAVGQRFIYLHDWGAPVGLSIAMQSPELVEGLIIQNANAHRSGFAPQWEATFAYWSDPTPENKARATTFLTYEGTRDQYTRDVPAEVVAKIKGEPWVEDWRVLNLPGRMEMQRTLLADYGKYVARFDAIGAYLKQWQPPALMIWGRHDAFFDIAETLSWIQDLPRMEAHILDGGHFLLETHPEPAAAFMTGFIKQTRERSATRLRD
ncbi:pimeloyl-ACP methyl ester carboxylesterase [Neorhizobium sp. R1-B]|uniref:alpha/beta fold hydrolase n=1 Tax=Neorhizobium TaxID=1525371 RepID=UPI000CF8DE80|nr:MULTISPECIES: alpha/beta hydrolase [Neorhizobium]TCV74565.1 pimeloyl-ACP methyl ester carboxylesterase [Neorhizobium sp. S3-V5DH]TDX87752.1 pimeloyl-ACP methyl ester carboxylesterase [Neorhizobium sp. R1-B]